MDATRRRSSRGRVKWDPVACSLVRLALPLACALLLAGCVLAPREPARPYHEQVIAGAPFTDLVIEIDHAPGREPSVAAREHLVDQLRAVTAKTLVRVEVQETLDDDADKRWTSAELVALEAQTRSTAHAEPVAVLHVLYPAGTHATSANATGITISDTVNVATVTVFLDRIAEFETGVLPTPLPYPDDAIVEIEKATLLHEVGHAMGLVNAGLPMVRPHEDAANPGHSTNNRSVMWASVDQEAGIRQALFEDGSLPFSFDEDDRADIRRAGGR